MRSAGRSRRRVRSGRRSPGRITLNLTSMIDVIFLLLLYFMVSTVLTRPEDKLSPTLRTRREPAQGAVQDFQPQIIEVVATADGPRYQIGARTLHDRAELLALLSSLPTSAGVVVNVHASVPVDFAVAAIQCARDAGFDQVTYVPAE